jgi:hypothetical protein
MAAAIGSDRCGVFRYQPITGVSTTTAGQKSQRRYQKSLSKHSTKLSRYSASGTIHSIGTEAMSCVMKADTASSATVPSAASTSHSLVGPRQRRCRRDGRLRPLAATGLRRLRAFATATTDTIASTANSPKPTDHATACARSANTGSSTKGYTTSAASAARFDSANSR